MPVEDITVKMDPAATPNPSVVVPNPSVVVPNPSVVVPNPNVVIEGYLKKGFQHPFPLFPPTLTPNP